jgi:hypothetical protein
MKYKINEKIKIRREEETSLIFDPDEDNFIELSPTALEILDLCKEGKDSQEIVKILNDKYDAGPEEIEKDVNYVLALLEKIKVLTIDENN